MTTPIMSFLEITQKLGPTWPNTPPSTIGKEASWPRATRC